MKVYQADIMTGRMIDKTTECWTDGQTDVGRMDMIMDGWTWKDEWMDGHDR